MNAVLEKVALPSPPLDGYPWRQPIKILVDPTTKLLQQMWALGYREAATGLLADGFSVPNVMAAAWAAQRAGELVTDVDGVTRDRVLATLRDLLGSSFSDPTVTTAQLVGRIQDEFAEMAKTRADLIARTEIAMAAGHGSAAGWSDSGVTYVEISDGDDFDEECLVGDTIVTAAGIERIYARQAQGQVIDFRTAAGDLFTVTPNHPVLTPSGWVAAGLLSEGDEVLRALDRDRLLRAANPGRPDERYVPARIEETVDLALKSGEWLAVVKPTVAHDFHGDGRDSEVHVVATNRELRNRVEPSEPQEILQDGLVLALMGAGAVTAKGGPAEALIGVMPTAPSLMRSGGPGQALLSGGGRVASALGSGVLADRQPGPSVGSDDGSAVDPEFPGDRASGLTRQVARMGRQNVGDARLPGRPWLPHNVSSRGELPRQSSSRDRELLAEPPERDPGLVEATRLIHVERKAFRGHVYNLGTHSGWYLADNVIVHNCAEADGQIWSVDYYDQNVISHPNCTRSASPISTEDALAAGVDQE